MTSEKEAYVYVQLPGALAPVPAAKLTIRETPRGFVGTFGYGRRYLEREGAIALDPQDLPLGVEPKQFTEFQGVPRALLDAGPNAWGRRVIEAKLRKKQGDLWELDYLLEGPEDGAGNLSFGRSAEPPGPRRPYNRTINLADLMRVAEKIAENEPLPQELLENIEPGTSMGGMRAKATVEDDDALWIAKFQEKSDKYNIPLAEHGTLQLAKACGIRTNESKLVKVGGSDILLLKRFDRQYIKREAAAGYLRYGYLSAHTLLRCAESTMDRERWSYLLLADIVRKYSVKPVDDCNELYRRMIFNALVTNDDDHPRNHGLILTERGWRLSPAFDLVPGPRSTRTRTLAMTIGEQGRVATAANLLSEAERFGLKKDQARKEIDAMVEAVKGWQRVYASAGVDAGTVNQVATAFLPEGFFDEHSEPVT